MPSVVNISSTQTIKSMSNPFKNFQFPPGSPFEDMFKEFNRPTERKATALGSGFIIDKKGIVVTNNHVIQGAEDIIVSVNGSTEYKAKVIGKDPYMDLAVLQIESDEKFEPVSFGDSDKSRIGDWVIAIGNPFGFGGTVTSGIISSRYRDIGLTRYDDFIQTDASINQGNSGGPLFDLEGKVIGINTAIIGSAGSVGIGFAVPSNTVLRILPDLLKYGYVRRPWLGIEPIPTVYLRRIGIDVPEGLLIKRVVKGASADQAGLRGASRTVKVGRYQVPWGGDIITHINKIPITTMEDLAQQIETRKAGEEITIHYIRNDRVLSVTVELVLRPRS